MRRALKTWVAIGGSCLALICSVHSAASQEGTQLKIGFWNIRDLSTASRNSSELDQIATVAHAIDCLAICKLNDGTGWVVSDYKELNPSAVRGIDFQQVALQADNPGADPFDLLRQGK
jgi:hypothetical protein